MTWTPSKFQHRVIIIIMISTPTNIMCLYNVAPTQFANKTVNIVWNIELLKPILRRESLLVRIVSLIIINTCIHFLMKDILILITILRTHFILSLPSISHVTFMVEC